MTQTNERNHDFDADDIRIHAGGERLIAQMMANRAELEAAHQSAWGFRKASYAKKLASADQELFLARSSHEAFTDHLIAGGVLPESKRPEPVLENDTRTQAQKYGLAEDHPALAGDHTRHGGPQAAGGSGQGTRGKSLQTSTPGIMRGLELSGRARENEAPIADAAQEYGRPGDYPALAGDHTRYGSPQAAGRSGQVIRSKSLPIATHGKATAGAGDPRGPEEPERPKGKSLQTSTPEMIQEAVAAGKEHPDETMGSAAVRGFMRGLELGARAREIEARKDDAAPQQPGSKGPGSRVRNAEGLTLQDLAAPAPGEDPLPGTTQPFALDAIDEVQGHRPPRAVVMDPGHTAALRALETGRDSGRENEEDRFDR